LYQFFFETKRGSMMAIATIFDGIPRTRVDENRFYGRLALFTVQVLVVGDSGV
jgi:hypothetical protein